MDYLLAIVLADGWGTLCPSRRCIRRERRRAWEQERQLKSVLCLTAWKKREG